MAEIRCSCGEPLFEDPDTGVLHCLKPHDMVDNEPAPPGFSRLMSQQRDAIRELHEAMTALGHPEEEQISTPGDAETLRLIAAEAEDLLNRIRESREGEDVHQLHRELRQRVAVLGVTVAASRVAMAYMEIAAIKEAEAVLDEGEKPPEQGASDGPP